jgi:hypothetical protein
VPRPSRPPGCSKVIVTTRREGLRQRITRRGRGRCARHVQRLDGQAPRARRWRPWTPRAWRVRRHRLAQLVDRVAAFQETVSSLDYSARAADSTSAGSSRHGRGRPAHRRPVRRLARGRRIRARRRRQQRRRHPGRGATRYANSSTRRAGAVRWRRGTSSPCRSPYVPPLQFRRRPRHRRRGWRPWNRPALRARVQRPPPHGVKTYSILLSLDPAVAGLAGLLLLGQDLSSPELLGIALVMAAAPAQSPRSRTGHPPTQRPSDDHLPIGGARRRHRRVRIVHTECEVEMGGAARIRPKTEAPSMDRSTGRGWSPTSAAGSPSAPVFDPHVRPMPCPLSEEAPQQVPVLRNAAVAGPRHAGKALEK